MSAEAEGGGPRAGGARVEQVEAAVGRELRMSVLRPHEPSTRAMYPLEDDPATVHLAALGPRDEVLSVGSAMADPHPRSPRSGDWRIRGMATAPQRRGEGYGALVLDALLRLARERGGARIWCNARSPAREFYARAGFLVEGAEFEIEGIGPHFLMSRPLA